MLLFKFGAIYAVQYPGEPTFLKQRTYFAPKKNGQVVYILLFPNET